MQIMICHMGTMIMQSGLVIAENINSRNSCFTVMSCQIGNWSYEATFIGQNATMGIKSVTFSRKSFQTSRHLQKIAFALNTSGASGNDGEENLDGDGSNLGRTRLGRIVSSGGRQLLEKLNSARKNFPMKIFLLLLGFYTANALATILGQTGDWDVLVAGVVVAAIEGIGILMYRKPPPLLTKRLKSFIVFINYWKAGVCLGLFVDAFKLGS